MYGELKKLKIEAFKDLEYNTKADEFEVMFNPSSYTQKYEVEYEESQGQGTTGTPQKFGKIKPQEYSFEFVFDGTGASGEKKDVSTEIDKFFTITGKVDGETHRPLYLKISWGSLISKCILKSADITYNLFEPDGYPLRAKVNAVFAENIDDVLRTAKENKSSPDLSHYREIREGENLPLLCYEIYGDSKYYADVAKANGLTDFRNLKPGEIIQFPPIKSKSAS